MTSRDELILTAIIDNTFHYARTPDEVAEINRLVVDVAHPGWASLLYLWDRPCRSVAHHHVEDNVYPEHQMRVYTDPAAGWGAINFLDETSSWDTHNAEPPADLELWFDPAGGSLFPATAAVPLDAVRVAVAEFTATGQRPKSIHWQPGRLQ
ncbi:Imm1 family immunity protein [Allokutzneria sp. NRRL B-24872]|uniref:Imm1 family immunity protein n=1 Tax=Allokutzneria sp. NRRL B-24872 TaxID=1137961 RepID=UPI000A3CDDCF|nr:Imm1 family immunity protein [Allokutzneria sp. NRRL B-24872]